MEQKNRQMIVIEFQKELFSYSDFNNKMILNIKTEIKKNQFVSVRGASGSGKTTFLRILSGLETPKSGKIVVNSEVWFDSEEKINLPPQKRDVGFVFQNYALFPNMTVLENLTYVKKDKKLAEELLNIVELYQLKDIKPDYLSGGQKQRVALIRAIMKKPKLLLLDEPLSALDPKIRNKLQQYLIKLHKKFQITTILVSHDPSEIYKLSERIITIKNGKIIEDSSPEETFLKSKNKSSISKFAFLGEILEIKKVDILNVAVISIGNQIVEVVLDNFEAINFKVGEQIKVSTKAFSPIISKI
jgi:molybdate transport system ATP-binding protein